ncbi:MAG: dTDP-4-dehydrorhamnose reductase [Patescibacteria group bacterium]
MKILILGAKGMLGTDLMQVFSDHQPTGLDLPDLDITDNLALEKKLKELRPELVINAAAYTKVDDCEENIELAYNVNGRAPGYLAKYCRQIGAKLVHYSTDYVFNGQKKKGYREDDTVSPLNMYGKTKMMGEKVVFDQIDEHYILRTAWLYGQNGPNFVKTMIDLSEKQPELKVVNDQFGSPTYTLDLAKKTKEIIEDKKIKFGTYHLTNSGTCSWYEFAIKIFEILGKDVKITPVTTEEFPRPAKRPKYSILKNTKLEPLRSWEEALKEYLSHEK